MVKKPDLIDLPEVARFKQRRRHVVGWLILVIIVGALSAQPVYRTTKQWRARSMASEATLLVPDSLRLEEAFAMARAAYRLSPQDPQVLSALAQVLAAQNDWPKALAFWNEALERDPQPSPSLRRSLVEAALRVRDADAAQPQIATLLELDHPSAADHLLAARLHRQAGEISAAREAARTALKIDPQHDPAALFLVECLLSDDVTRDDGLKLLREISQRPSEGGLAALHRRAELGGSAPEELRRLAAALRTHPRAAEGHRLLALSLELRVAPGDRAVLLDAAVQHYQTTPPEVLRQFAAWLLGEGEARRALDLLPEERALMRKDFFLVRLDAMAAEAQWHEILQLLDRPQLPLEEVPRHLYRARCLEEVGKASRARVAWRSALDSAGRDASVLLYIAAYAEKFGAVEPARLAYRQLTENPESARMACEALLRLTPREDTVQTRELLATMAERWPHDLTLANDLTYLNALLERELPACLEKARALVRAAPSSLPPRTVLALTELRLGNPEAAFETYQGLEIDWRQAAPGSVVVYAATLLANGREHEALQLASLASADQLRPEEQALKPREPGPF